MVAFTDTILDEEAPRARVALLLEHFSELGDDREPWRVMYPLKEVLLLLVVCATIASCDDFYDIVAWGEHHLDFLRRFSAFHHGIPCERWVRMLVNRVDPILFGGPEVGPDRHISDSEYTHTSLRFAYPPRTTRETVPSCQGYAGL